MQRYRLVMKGTGAKAGEQIALETPSVPVALLVADINMSTGTAEIWQGDTRIAHMRKRRAAKQVFWELA